MTPHRQHNPTLILLERDRQKHTDCQSIKVITSALLTSRLCDVLSRNISYYPRRYIMCSMQSGNLAQSADCTVQSADCRLHGGRAVCRLHAMQSADCMPCSLQTARGPFQWEFFWTRVIIRFLSCNWGKQ